MKRTHHFGPRLKAILDQRRVSQTELARRMGKTPQYVSQLVNGRRRVTAATSRLIAAALGIMPEVLYPELDAQRKKTALEIVQARLDEECSTDSQPQRQCCTFYVRDNHWVDEFSLAAMAGVHHREPMWGLLVPEAARQVVLGNADDETDADTFVSNTRATSKLFEEVPLLSAIPASVRDLFGNFPEREGIKSTARLVHRDASGTRDAILFVSYREFTEFDESLKRRLGRLLRDLTTDIPAIQKDLHDRDGYWLVEATKIVSPTWSVANIDFEGFDNPNPYFRRIIDSALQALKISAETGLGTLHIFNPEESVLELRASSGVIVYPERAAKHVVRSGQGIVSWVVMLRRALLISDLRLSAFERIHVGLNDAVRSELAVPLEAGGELIGVLCLECTEPGRFLPRHVKSLWYAANRAALVFQMHQQVSMNRTLLKLCAEATAGADAAVVLRGLADLASNYLKASSCEIVGSDGGDGYLSACSSLQALASHHVPDTLTEYVRQWSCPVWLTSASPGIPASWSYWHSTTWKAGLPTEEAPSGVDGLLGGESGVRSMLGVPILIARDCVGVAWVKYKRDRLARPAQGLIQMAEGFAAEAGLVVNLIHQRQERITKKAQAT